MDSLSRVHRPLLVTANFACWIPPQALKRKVALVRINLLLLPLKCTSAVPSFTLLFLKCCIFPTAISSSQSYLLYQPCSPQTSYLRPILFSQYMLAVKSKLFILFLVGRISLLSRSHLLSQSVFFLIFSHACQSVCPIPDDSSSLPPGSPSNPELGLLSSASFDGIFSLLPLPPFWQYSQSPTHIQLNRNFAPSFSASNPELAQENRGGGVFHMIFRTVGIL